MTAMMEKYEMRRQIGPSICDASGKLSHAEAFGLFMDIASFHAEQIGVGLGPKGSFLADSKDTGEFYPAATDAAECNTGNLAGATG